MSGGRGRRRNSGDHGVEIVQKMVEAMNQRDYDALAEVVSPNIVRHSSATPELKVTSLAEFEQFLRANVVMFPDERQEVDAIFGAGDMVGVRARYLGTQKGAMGPFPPSGKHLELPFLAIARVEDDKVAELWVEWDNINMLKQLGHFPPPGAKPEPGRK